MTDIQELIERWNSDEGKPYKGKLIDIRSYVEGDLSCMCAQGQVLHVAGKWDAARLASVNQDEADRETAKLLNISLAHAILLRNTNDSLDGAPAIVLTDPAKVLGDQWSRLLDFWWHLDSLNSAARKAARDAAWTAAWAAARDTAWAAARDTAWAAARDAAWAAARDAAWDAAWAAAWAAARKAAGDAAWKAARDTAWAAAWAAARKAAGDAAWKAARDTAWAAARDAAWTAAWEIQGTKAFERDGRDFFFLPMFGFASPDDIPARPAHYGVKDQ